MSKRFKRNLQIGFGLSLLLLLCSSLASFYSLTHLINSTKEVEHTNKVLQHSEAVIANLRDGETGQRGYLLTKEPDFLVPYNGAFETALKEIDEIKLLTTDNLSQQDNCDTLRIMVTKRFGILQQSIERVRQGIEIDQFRLRDGRLYMDQARLMVKKIQNIEQNLLRERTARMNMFAGFTPVIVVVAALLAFLITIFFFKRVNDDFKVKLALNDTLELKDRETASRINIIENVAKKISAGEYSTRLNAEDTDDLGSLSVSLNRMAASLEQAFTQLQSNEWLQKGSASLSEEIAGDKEVKEIANNIIQFVCRYTNSHVGALYLADETALTLAGSYALSGKAQYIRVKPGQGLVGQCFTDGKAIHATEIDESLYTTSALGDIKPKSIFISPLTFEGRRIGVVEIGSLGNYRELDMNFVENVEYVSAACVNTAYNRTKLKELLEETQSQSEELQAQHRELENMNAELEAQAEKLQTSEEELRVQQEELQETNGELEERSRLLEEKNQVIVLRNLEIQKKAEELAISTRYKSEFLANMSHELRTPLNSVLLLSRLLEENNEGNLNKQQIEYASVIRSSGNGLLELIDEILDLSKIESGKLELEYEQVAIKDILRNMQMLFEPMAKEKGISFTLSTDETVPEYIETDQLRLEQILKNLLSNALKFTHKGSIRLNVDLSNQNDHYILFSVKDSGIGIPEEKQQLIFEAFQQADGSTKRKYGGTGLGLSISKQLALLLSGDISLTSNPAEGSEFTLAIPAFKTVTNKQSSTASLEIKTTENAAEKISAPSKFLANQLPDIIPDDDRGNILPTDKVLLIVEDDIGFARALLDFARQKGYKGIIVVRGDEAMGMAKLYHPLGILLDIQLPVKDGFSVMDELKSDVRTRHIPVHTMSSFEAKKESIDRGAVDFIHKPVLFDQMNVILDRIAAVNKQLKKVLIVEENTLHAKALSYFLSTQGVNAEISQDISGSIELLKTKEVNCVILDMNGPGIKAYETLDSVKQHAELEHIPIIIFTGKPLSRTEEQRIRQYADSIVVKTAQSYQRIFSEVSLFLHLVYQSGSKDGRDRKLGTLDEVLKNKTVLVADDDVRNIFALTKALEKHQMQVVAATDGREALQILETNTSIDIVLMDMMMPEMDGYESISRIRQNNKFKKLPVIAVTAKAMTGDRDKCIQAGASDYISKPVDTDQLISLMRIWLYEGI
jgi:signal transduction histidine kinase/DNA-binding response OmpR family regulator/CHASE3 domain sensor protein/HAMP domain-containing protein